MASKTVVKVAVIGSGLAGLTAAHFLSLPLKDPDVILETHLFEKARLASKLAERGYYPSLEKLYNKLGVKFRSQNFSYSFSILGQAANQLGRHISTTFIYNGASGRAGLGIPSTFRRTKTADFSPSFISQGIDILCYFVMTVYVALCFLRLLIFSLPVWRTEEVRDTTFEQWIQRHRWDNLFARILLLDSAWDRFTMDILIPLFSAVCTAPAASVLAHPVEEFLDYIWLTLGTDHYVVVNGVQDVVKRLTQNLDHAHLGCTITSISPDLSDSSLASIHCETAGRQIVYDGFHHIIFATQASRAVPLLASYSASFNSAPDSFLDSVHSLINCLRSFTYHRNVVINHTDATLMPDNQKDWRDLNLIVADDQYPHNLDTQLTVDPSFAMATHRLISATSNGRQVFQSTNPVIPPKKDTILSISRLERAVLTLPAKRALQGLISQEPLRAWQCPVQKDSRLGPLQGAGKLQGRQGPGIWICGSYAYAGIPLLEGCVVSARNVVEQGILTCEGTALADAPW